MPCLLRTSGVVRRMTSSDSTTKVGCHPLFVSGERATNTTCVVNPEYEDFDEETAAEVGRSLALRRGTDSDGGGPDLKRLARGVGYLRYFQTEEERLEKEADQLMMEKRELDQEEEKQKVLDLASRIKELRKKARLVKRDRWSLEDSVVLPVLELPNRLSECCPLGKDEVLLSWGSWPQQVGDAAAPRGHVQVARGSLDFLPAVSQSVYHPAFYLYDGLAREEMDLARKAKVRENLHRGFGDLQPLLMSSK